MRISDWSSDVCSSDLGGGEMRVERLPPAAGEQREAESEAGAWGDVVGHAPIIRRYDLICNSQYMAATDTAVNRRAAAPRAGPDDRPSPAPWPAAEIGRAACRERVCKDG